MRRCDSLQVDSEVDTSTAGYERRSDLYTYSSTQLPFKQTEDPGTDRGSSEVCGLLYQMRFSTAAWHQAYVAG